MARTSTTARSSTIAKITTTMPKESTFEMLPSN
jgi:hypothetical protein